MPDQCDAACMKIIIDTGMGISFGKLYGRVLARTPSLRPIDYETPMLYADALGDFREAAQALNSHRPPLSAEQRNRLMAQVDKACYRADKLLAWSEKDEVFITSHAQGWTAELLGWVKDDQTVYTELAKEMERP